MTLTRWKLMAGVLGISIVGVVAMANPQCPNTKKDQARETAPPGRVAEAPPNVTTAGRGRYEVTLKDPLLTPALPAVGITLPPPVAKLETFAPPALNIGSQVVPSLPSVVVEPTLPKIETPPSTPLPKSEPTALSELPNIKGLDLPNTVPAVSPPKVELPKVESAPKLDLPKVDAMPPKSDRVVELPLPGVTAPKPALPVPDLPAFKEAKPIELAPPVAAVEKPSAAPPRVILDEPPVAALLPKIEPKKLEATPTKTTKPAASEESAVRIVIHLGTGQPKFDVMAGDDALLKAVCNNIDIRSPNENGAGVTPLKAGGKVQFSAPGCEGTCDSLTVLPTTGEVELAGNVKVHCRLGKGSTEINATTMKFKLGSAPAYTVPEPAVTPVSGRQ